MEKALVWRRASSVVCGAVILMGLNAAQSVSALTIELDYDEYPYEAPSWDSDGSELTRLMRAGRTIWEDIIKDSHDLRVQYQYEDLGPDAAASCTSHLAELHWYDSNGNGVNDKAVQRVYNCTIRVDPDVNWYVDPTPFDNSEWPTPNQILWRDLTHAPDGGERAQAYDGAASAYMEAAFEYRQPASTPPPRDLLTTVLHEMGHALGFNEYSIDGDSPYRMAPFMIWGSNVSAHCERGEGDQNRGHIDTPGALMSYNRDYSDVRTLPSATDVAVMAHFCRWRNIDMPRKDFFTTDPGVAFWGTEENWTGRRIPDAEDAAFIRSGADVRMPWGGEANSLLIDEDSRLTVTNNHSLTLSSLEIGPTGTLLIDSAGSTVDFLDPATGAPDPYPHLTVEGSIGLSSLANQTFGSLTMQSPADPALTSTLELDGRATLSLLRELRLRNGTEATLDNAFILDAGIDASEIELNGPMTLQNDSAIVVARLNLSSASGVDPELSVLSGSSFGTTDSTPTGDVVVPTGGAITVRNTDSELFLAADTTIHGELEVEHGTAEIAQLQVTSSGRLSLRHGALLDGRDGGANVSFLAGSDITVRDIGTEIRADRLYTSTSFSVDGGARIYADLARVNDSGAASVVTLELNGVGTVVDTADLEIDASSGSGASVRHNTGLVVVDDDLAIEQTSGEATYALADGGLTIGDELRIDGGTMHVQGGELTTDRLTVGDGGAGIFTLDEGTAEVNGEFTLARNATSSATVNLNGGALTLHGDWTHGDGHSTVNVDGGTLAAADWTLNMNVLNLGNAAGTDGELFLGARDVNADTIRIGVEGRAHLDMGGDVTVHDAWHVGHGHILARVDQSAGAATAPTVYLGTEDGGSGTWEMTGGSLDADTLYAGHEGTGRLIVDGGTVTLVDLVVGHNQDSPNNYVRLQDGTVDLVHALRIGAEAAGGGTFHLAGADLGDELTCRFIQVGDGGSGEFKQSGGLNTVEIELQLGRRTDSNGTYELTGGQLDTPLTRIGTRGTGTFAHSGGLNNTDELRVGEHNQGEYTLSGAGELITTDLHVGHTDQGTFNQEGGSSTTGTLHVGHGDDTVGAYVHTGGNMHVVGAAVLGRGARSTATYAIGDGPESGIAQHIEGSLDIGLGEDSDGFYHVKGRVLPVGGEWSHAGSTTVDGEVRIGGAGAGRLRIDGGGTLTAHDTVAVGSATDPGTLQLDGGAIGGDGSVEVAASNGAITGRGTVDLPVVNDGEIVSTGLNFEEHVSGSGTVTVDADWDTVSFASAELDGAVTNRGTLYAGAPGQTVRLAGGLSGDGTVQVDGGRLEIAADASPGSLDIFMEGTICQESGTTVNAGGVSVGEFGVYRLHETGGATDLSVVGATRVDGEFDHRGGAHASDTLRIGGNPSAYMRVDPAEYRLRSGRLETANLQIGYDPDDFGGAMPVPAGSLAVDRRDAEITVSESLVLGPSARLDIAGGATIHMTGTSFENHSEDPAALADLDRLKLVFEGGATDADPFEVAGENVGADLGGFRENFALGTLELGGADIGHVLLRDAVDNQLDGDLDNEAQYVKMLTLGAGSTLDLDGLDLYYLNACIDASATVTGGTATAVAPPDARAEIEGVAPGSVTVTYDHGSSGPMGTGGIGAFGDVAALSGTVVLDPDEIDAAVAASPSGYVTFKLYYDESEVELWEIDEASLRPYWWSGAEWVPGGTTTAGDPGAGAFAGLDTAPADFGMGYYGLDTGANFLWSNITHASMYGAGGNQAAAIPEPATAALFALAAALLARRRPNR